MPVKKAPPVPPTDKALDCAGRIVALIRAGQIVPQRRIGESSLADRLKVSRATVRSSLEHLEIAGLVARVARSGTFVREISIGEFCDVMDIRAALETLAARLAADRASESDLQGLISKGKRVDSLSQRWLKGDPNVMLELVQSDLEFHLSIAEISGNRRLASTLKQQRLIEAAFALTQSIPPSHVGKSGPIPTHLEIAEAMASRDKPKAEDLMRRHILRTKEARLGMLAGESA